MSEPIEELSLEEAIAPPPSDGEVVHWMSPGPLRLQPAGLTATAVAGFVLGAAAAFGAMAALRWLAPRREGLPPWRWRRGRLH